MYYYKQLLANDNFILIESVKPMSGKTEISKAEYEKLFNDIEKKNSEAAEKSMIEADEDLNESRLDSLKEG